MKRRCVLTVGANPLPMLVAAPRLLQRFLGAPLKLVHSLEREDEAKAILTVLATRLNGRSADWKAIPIADAHDLERISMAEWLKNLVKA